MKNLDYNEMNLEQLEKARKKNLKNVKRICQAKQFEKALGWTVQGGLILSQVGTLIGSEKTGQIQLLKASAFLGLASIAWAGIGFMTINMFKMLEKHNEKIRKDLDCSIEIETIREKD